MTPSDALRVAHRDIRPVLLWAFARGWRPVGWSGRRHLRLVGPQGQTVVTGVRNTSAHHAANMRADLPRSERRWAGALPSLRLTAEAGRSGVRADGPAAGSWRRAS